MPQLLCRNRVRDFEHWRRVFDAHLDGPRGAGLRLVAMWREIDDPANVFFLFEAESVARARAFLAEPSGAEIGREAGVIDGECRFLEPVALP